MGAIVSLTFCCVSMLTGVSEIHLLTFFRVFSDLIYIYLEIRVGRPLSWISFGSGYLCLLYTSDAADE